MARLVLALALVLVLAGPASAAEQQTLTREKPTATFQGKTGVGVPIGYSFYQERFPCLPQDLNCETTLIRIDTRGRLDVTATHDSRVPYLFGPSLRLFASDSAGRFGDQVARSPSSSLTAPDLPAGFYLLLVRWEEGVHSYQGRLALTPHSRK